MKNKLLPKRNTVIESLGLYLPSREVTTAQILNGCHHAIDLPIDRLTGIQSRRMAQLGEYALDIAKQAVQKCLDQSRHGVESIDLLICCNISRMDGAKRFSFEPSTALKLQRHFGLRHSILFDISNACAGIFTGILLADAYLRSGMAKRALVVSGEYITHLTENAQKEITNIQDPRLACLTLGDSGLAMMLELGKNGSTGFNSINLLTLGAYSDYCIAKTTDRSHGGCMMYTDSAKMAKIGIESTAILASTAILQQGWQPENIQHLITHQTARMNILAGLRALNDALGKRVFIEDQNALIGLKNRGNTSTNSHFVTLADYIQNGKIQDDDKIIFCIQASGMTLGTALYTLDDLPSRIKDEGYRKLRKIDQTNTNFFLNGSSAGLNHIKISQVGLAYPREIVPGKTLPNAISAIKDCLVKAEFAAEDLELIIFAGVYREGFICEPAIASLLLGELLPKAKGENLSEARCFAFDISNGAVGFLNTIQSAIAMIQSGKVKNALIVTAEVENNALSFPHSMMGIAETASAVLLQATQVKSGFETFFSRQFPHLQSSYYVDTTWDQAGKAYLDIHRDPDLDSVYLEAIWITLQEMQEKECLNLEEIDWVLSPQISSAFIQKLGNRLQVLPNKMIDVCEDQLDLFSASIPYAFSHLTTSGNVKAGDRVLLIGVGSGIQVAGAIYKIP